MSVAHLYQHSGGDTGEYPLHNGRPARAGTPTVDPLTTRHRPMYYLAGLLLLLAVIAGTFYGFTAAAAGHIAGSLLFIITTALLVGSLVALIGAVGLRTNGLQLQMLKCSLRRTINEATDIGTLRAQLLALTAAIVDNRQTLNDLAGIPADVRAYSVQLAEVSEALTGRLTALERRQDDVEAKLASPAAEAQLAGDNAYLAGYADGLAGRTLDGGKVVPLNGANGHGGR